MNDDLQTIGTREMAGWAPDPWEDDDIMGSATGVTIPLMKVLYDETKDKPDGAPNGMLFNNVTGEVKPSASVVLLAAKIGNVWQPPFDPKAKTQEAAFCKSNDGEKPCGGSMIQPGPCRAMGRRGAIEVCPKLKWQNGPKGKRIKPECATFFTACFMDLETDLPFVFTFKRTGVKVWRDYVNKWKSVRMQHVRKEYPMSPRFYVPVILGTKKVDNYWIPTLTIPNPAADPMISVDKAATYAMLSEDFRQELLKMDMDAVTDADQPSGGNDDIEFPPPE
jgi:hypothetical protein